jgi:thioesterase domain-containing protein
VAQAVVVLRRDDPANPRLIAYWVADPAESAKRSAGVADGEPLRAFLAERLPDHLIPAAFVELPVLPLSGNGKLDRKALPAPSFSGDLAHRVEPATELERMLHGLWAEVLGHGNFGITDNFFQVGGHSLAAARLAAAVLRARGEALPVTAIFHCPTIHAQASRLVRSLQAGAAPNLVSLQPEGDRPPLFVLHGWGGTVGHFIELSRAFAPHRPVLGLQASGAGDGDGRPSEPVAVLAARYAEQILARHSGGPIHLLGYSAGGWYAHAVAAALLERGGRIGLFAVLDSHATARIHRRLGLLLLTRQLVGQLGPQLRRLAATPQGEGRGRYLLNRLRTLNRSVEAHLHVRAPLTAEVVEEPFVQLLREGYRPPRLPLVVDLFGPADHLPQLRILWRFYGRGGVRLHPLFQGHFDFMRAELMPELAAALEDALKLAESDP